MNHMMYTTGWNSALPFLFGIHVVGMIAATIGVILLVTWCIKHLSEKNLWKYGWTLVIAGVIVCLLTIGFMGHSFKGGYEKDGYGMMGGNGKVFRAMPMMQWSNASVSSDEAVPGAGTAQ